MNYEKWDDILAPYQHAVEELKVKFKNISSEKSSFCIRYYSEDMECYLCLDGEKNENLPQNVFSEYEKTGLPIINSIHNDSDTLEAENNPLSSKDCPFETENFTFRMGNTKQFSLSIPNGWTGEVSEEGGLALRNTDGQKDDDVIKITFAISDVDEKNGIQGLFQSDSQLYEAYLRSILSNSTLKDFMYQLDSTDTPSVVEVQYTVNNPVKTEYVLCYYPKSELCRVEVASDQKPSEEIKTIARCIISSVREQIVN